MDLHDGRKHDCRPVCARMPRTFQNAALKLTAYFNNYRDTAGNRMLHFSAVCCKSTPGDLSSRRRSVRRVGRKEFVFSYLVDAF